MGREVAESVGELTHEAGSNAMSRKRWGVPGGVGAVVMLGGAAVLLQGEGEQDTGPPGVTVERGSVAHPAPSRRCMADPLQHHLETSLAKTRGGRVQNSV